MDRTRVLLIEDDGDSAEAIATLLELEGFEVQWLTGGSEALQVFESARRTGSPAPEVVVLDLRLGTASGAVVAHDLQAIAPGLPIVIYSAARDETLQPLMSDSGILAALRKPEDQPRLIEILKALSRRSRPAAEIA